MDTPESHQCAPFRSEDAGELDLVAWTSLAPEGPRGVATGGARPPRASRNPWSACLRSVAPEGRRIPDARHLFPSVSDLMRTVKARASKWLHETYPNLAAFAWQEGYSVFSVSKSQEQAEHLRKEDFKSELLRTLLAHGLEFEEKYVFD